jgi:CheY-like chemotaxis protein
MRDRIMSDQSAAPLHGARILIAEDSWHLADAIRIAVQGAGGEVVGMVGTLAKAELLAASATFDAAVMDLDLHGEQAHGLAMRLAEAGKKVVVLSGYQPPPELAGKVHDCLTKPIPGEALIAALARPLRARDA